MTINIDDKVLDYLKKINSKAITIDLIGCASWGVGEPQPVVSPVEPKKDKEEFKLIKSGDIDVYVKNKINASNDTLSVKYKKVLFSEKLIVEGIVF